MSRSGFSLCALLALAMTASTSRVKVGSKLNFGGPHKCTITWNYRGQVATASFGVANCRIGCQVTFTDNSYDKVFPRAFTYYQNKNTCSCKHTSGEESEVLRFPGDCGEEQDAMNKCWNDYKILSTDSLEEQFGKDTLKIVHHPEMHHETTFHYDNPECVVDGCKDDPSCFETVLPSLMAGRSNAEKQLIGKLLDKIAKGEIQESGLAADVQAVVEGLTEEDREDIIYATMLGEEFEAGELTVRVLKDVYTGKLDGTGVSVDHLLIVAGMDPTTEEGLSQEVTKKMFKKFLEPDCPE